MSHLPIRHWQTRILRLHRGPLSDVVVGDLVIADIIQADGIVLHDEQKHVAYEALSYSWGWPELTGTVLVNGHRHGIPPPLEQALRQLRYEDQDRYLWADTLCIDQSNAVEKSVQVANMLTVYRKAKQTVVWLGIENPTKKSAIDALLRAMVIHQEVDSTFAQSDNSLSAFLQTYLKSLSTVDESLSSLKDLCCRPWIRRTWVQQEIFVSNKVLVYCGSCQIPYRLYRVIAHALLETALVDPDELPFVDLLSGLGPVGAEQLSQLEHDRHFENRLNRGRCSCDISEMPDHTLWNRWSRSNRLECVLRLAVELKATDTRDRIYALLGMTNCQVTSAKTEQEQIFKGVYNQELDRPTPTLHVDYTKSPSLVFQDAAKSIMNRDATIDILRYHFPSDGHGKDLGLPSWTADWRIFNRHLNRDSFAELHDSFLDWQNEQDEGQLVLTGLVLGLVIEPTHDGAPETEAAPTFSTEGNSDDSGNQTSYTPSDLPAWKRIDEETKSFIARYQIRATYSGTPRRTFRILWAPDEEPTASMAEIVTLLEEKPEQLMSRYGKFESPGSSGLLIRTVANARQGDILVKVCGANLPILLRCSPTEHDCQRFQYVGTLEESNELLAPIQNVKGSWTKAGDNRSAASPNGWTGQQWMQRRNFVVE